MAERYSGKVVMITGAASGFGRIAAQRFAAEGARLVLSDIAAKAIDGLAAEFGDIALGAAVDVTDEAQIAAHVTAGVDRFGTIDVAINNAGAGHALAPLHALDAAEFDRMIAVNARSAFLGMKYQLPVMLEAKQGAILNVSSAAGLVGAGYLSAYAAAKHAVVGLTRAAADEVARRGIRINALCPSFANTPLFNEMADQVADRHGLSRSQAYDRISARIPMARVADPEEVVQAMLWICDEANSFMTGQAISIDGGLTAV